MTNDHDFCRFVFGISSVIQHLVAFLRDSGYGSQSAASALGFTVGVSVLGRLVFGLLADRLGQRAIMALALALAGLSILLLFRIQSPAALPAFVILFGLALGGSAVLFPLLVGEYFGLVASPGS